MTVISPASPPPTTRTRRILSPLSLRMVLFAAMSLLFRSEVFLAAVRRRAIPADQVRDHVRHTLARGEVDRGVGAQEEHGQADDAEDRGGQALRAAADRDAPREAEAPQAVGEVEHA